VSDLSMLQASLRKKSRSMGVKLMVICALALLMIIPMLFVEGLEFVQGGPLPLVSVRAVNGQQNQFQLPLEVIAFNSRLPFTQLIVRLPENLSPGDLMVTVTVNGQASNSARISIKP